MIFHLLFHDSCFLVTDTLKSYLEKLLKIKILGSYNFDLKLFKVQLVFTLFFVYEVGLPRTGHSFHFLFSVVVPQFFSDKLGT
jgi:hypothetical protein